MKTIKRSLTKIAILSIALSTITGMANATTVKVEVTNLFANDGLAITPVWAGFHDGTFDSFNVGETASANVQALAEGGMLDGIRNDFSAQSSGVDGVIFGPEGFPGAPVIEPGEVASAEFEINSLTSGYFSFLSMLIPTNDAFIGNDEPDRYSLFDLMGAFVGLDILVLGSQVWDSGTELNTGFGSPFLLGADAQDRQDENGVISQHQGLQVLAGGLPIIGGQTPAGYTIDELAADFTAQGFEVARITISEVTEVSAPTLGLVSILAILALAYRRKV